MTITCTIGGVVSSAVVSYAMARMRFKGRGFWFGTMMLTMCIPGQVLQVPSYLMFHKIGWTGSYLPIIVPAFTAAASTVFMMMKFLRIILPLIKPALGIAFINAFIGNW